MIRHLAIGRLWHEGNSFSPLTTGRDQFRNREWVEPEAAMAYYRGTATEMGAVVAFLDAEPGWAGSVLLAAAAPPGGPVEHRLYAELREHLLTGLAARSWHGVYLSLHGALVTDRDPAPELELLRAVRQAIGATPLAVTFDLHANLAPEIGDLADIALAYKTYPHLDMRETAAKALHLLAAAVEGRIRPRLALTKVPAMLPSFNMRTSDGPMAEAQMLARRLEARPGILDVSPVGGFAYGDTPYAGASVLALADGDREKASDAAREVADFFWQHRARFQAAAPPPEAALALALAEPPGLIALVDCADNPLSGGIGDTPGLIRALVEARPEVTTVFAFFFDPPLVARAHAAGVGAILTATLGGRLTPDFGSPVKVEARVLRVTDGRFRNLGPMEAGLPVALGRTALLGIGEHLQVIVTETCQSPNDLAYFTLHGIDLDPVRLLCVKAKNHFRAAFAKLCRAIIETDAPGPAGFDPTRLPFRHAPPDVVQAINR